jgi:hypothetical protein
MARETRLGYRFSALFATTAESLTHFTVLIRFFLATVDAEVGASTAGGA